jgi:beta-lactamase class A
MATNAGSEWRKRLQETLAATLLSFAALLALGGFVAGSSAAAPPAGPAARQFEWVVAVLNGSSAPSAAALHQHFTPGFLKAVSPQQLLEAFYPAWSKRPVTVQTITDAPTMAVATLVTSGTRFRLSLTVEPTASHRINGLMLQPAPVKLTSWRAIDSALSRLGAQAALYVGSPGGRTIHASNAAQPLAIGSAFKLYVLGALAQAIEIGDASWQERLAISNAHKSLPSGSMASERAGTEHSLRDFAAQMISVSDNTAADHLIARLGRAAVERQLKSLGNHTPGLDEPFLTTRELFALKIAAPTALRSAYADGNSARRRALLPQIDALTPTLAEVAGWSTPRLINKIEWFASTSDLAKAISALVARSAEPKLAPLKTILALNPGFAVDRSVWPYVAYKGGSEPGVFSQTWYLERHDGTRFTVSLVVNDTRHQIDEITAEAVAQAVIAKLATNIRPVK